MLVFDGTEKTYCRLLCWYRVAKPVILNTIKPIFENILSGQFLDSMGRLGFDFWCILGHPKHTCYKPCHPAINYVPCQLSSHHASLLHTFHAARQHSSLLYKYPACSRTFQPFTQLASFIHNKQACYTTSKFTIIQIAI
jgi:hypothetical protein